MGEYSVVHLRYILQCFCCHVWSFYLLAQVKCAGRDRGFGVCCGVKPSLLTIITLNGSYPDGCVRVGRCTLRPLLLCLLYWLVRLFLLWEQTVALFHLFPSTLPPLAPALSPIDTSLDFFPSSCHLLPPSSPLPLGGGAGRRESKARDRTGLHC